MKEREFASFPLELAQVSTKGRTYSGYASVFDYPIESGVDQHTFVRPGAFTKTLKEHRSQIQVLFNHGMDPRYGQLPIGTIKNLKQDNRGLWAEVDLHDGPDNKNIIAALGSGALRAQSIQFETMQESFNDDRSERYIEQVRLWEFGPVTFPANEAATAALHSMAGIASMLGEAHWDGAAAMRTCDSAADFRQIAFERDNDSDPDTAAHWTLPHHPRPGAGPDSGGVAAALAALSGARGGAPQLKQSVETVRAHLQRHQTESSSDDDRGTEESAATSKPADRPIWFVKLGQTTSRHDREMAEMEARIKGL